MLKRQARVFRPASEFVGRTSIKTSVDRWELTAGGRLWVVFRDGLRFRSDYSGLRELFAGERVVEVRQTSQTPGQKLTTDQNPPAEIRHLGDFDTSDPSRGA